MEVKHSFNTITVKVDANCISASDAETLNKQRAIYGTCIPVGLVDDNTYGYATSGTIALEGFLMAIEGKSGAETEYVGTLLIAGKVVDIPTDTIIAVGTSTLVVDTNGKVASSESAKAGKWTIQKASAAGSLFVDIVG